MCARTVPLAISEFVDVLEKAIYLIKSPYKPRENLHIRGLDEAFLERNTE